MADTTAQQQSILVSGKTIIIYNSVTPDIYKISEVFDPQEPTSGLYFPAVYSLVIKEDGSVWYVADRDPNTFRVTLAPISITTIDEESKVSVISYMHDKFMCYLDKRTAPYNIQISSTLLLYGANLVEYTLSYEDANGETVYVSQYYDAAGTFRSNRVPLAPISPDYPTYVFPTNCHTTRMLDEGTPLTLRAYNNLGNVSAELTVYVRYATWFNDLRSSTNPIVKIDADSLQPLGDGFFCYEQQEPDALNIRPYLLYADGTKVYVPIDNKKTFVYGLENFIPAYAGRKQDIVIKYFLSSKETSSQVETKNGARFVACVKTITTVPNNNEYIVKLSTIPLWDESTQSYYLKFLAYSNHRDAVYDVTKYCKFRAGGKFDGEAKTFGVRQHVIVDYQLQDVFKTDAEINGAQNIWITMWPNTEYVKYTFQDNLNEDAYVFGVDGSITRRPQIHYDEELDVYFIPTSVFGNKEAVIESFYTLANPPYDTATETTPPTPTHFVVRNTSGSQLITTPIPLDEYGQSWPIISGIDIDVGDTVVVEFLQATTDDNYSLLYGVPVEISAGKFNS